ncbi:MAG: cytochrome c [Planctomycetes bacterium]|nr:cytochrome c [Planctomycetota bacterium]
MTKKYAMVLGIGVALVAGVGVLAVRAADTPAAPDIKKLADQVGKKSWDELAKEGQAVAKKHDDLLDIMNVFKPRSKVAKVSGIGVGDEPGAIIPDGIEQKIIRMAGKVGVTERDIAKAPALKRMSEIAAGVAAVAVHKPNDKAQKNAASMQKWKDWSKEMHDSAQDLIKALETKDRTQVKAAVMKLNGSCTKCHSEFRDD